MVPRSPAWLIYQGKFDEAKITLAKVIPESDIEAHVAEMKERVEESNISWFIS